MTGPSSIISAREILDSQFHTIKAGDIVCGRIPVKLGEEHLLLDLLHRGVHCIPSALSQMASRSKCFQARILSPWMVPETYVIYDAHQLLGLINRYQKKCIGGVVVKKERKNAGQGVLFFNSIEDVYTHAATHALAFPFVIQPFLKDSIDIRVILLGEYHEAYTRTNPYNFRNNLHCGGTAEPYLLSRETRLFCEEVMKRGDFPYGHLDLMLTQDGTIYMAEINLRGGIHGAKITLQEYKKRTGEIEKKLALERQRQHAAQEDT